MLKAILFDFGQSLVNSAEGFKTAEKEAKDKLYADLDPGNVSWDAFLREYRRLRKAFHRESNFSRPAIWQAVYSAFASKPNQEKLIAWEERYWEQVKEHTSPFPETLSVLKMLKRHYRLGLITNTQGQKSSDTHRIALFPELEQYFETIVVAGEKGIPPKPDPLAFRTCLEAMHIGPEEAAYVGDDWRIDICGARDMGIQPIWIQHHSVKRNWPDVEPFGPTITSLEELANLLFAPEKGN
jgi:HAD superfamily hydrolase (TIGR01549 family)